MIKYLIWVVVIVLLLSIIGVNVSVLLASLAALLVGVGLGIQKLFGDLASGIVLLAERSLKINDIIQLEDGTVGKVITIGLRTSKIKTRDNIIMIVPNSKFVNDRIINWSHFDHNTRFEITVNVAYGSNTQLVKRVLLECADKNSKVSRFPKPFVRFQGFEDSSLNFSLYFWAFDTFWVEDVKSELRFSIDAEFRMNNIRIPFPQRVIHPPKD